VCLQVKLCDPHPSALEVRFSRRGAIQIYVYLYLHVACCGIVSGFGRRWSVSTTSTCRTVGMRRPCYWWSSAYRRQLRRLFLARSHGVQSSESAGHVFLFVNTVRSSRLAAVNGPRWPTWKVSCRTLRRFTEWQITRLNWSLDKTFQ